MASESKIITGWIKEGREEGELTNARAMLLAALGRRFRASVPEVIGLAIEGTNDVGKFREWHLAVFDAADIAAFRRRIKTDA